MLGTNESRRREWVHTNSLGLTKLIGEKSSPGCCNNSRIICGLAQTDICNKFCPRLVKFDEFTLLIWSPPGTILLTICIEWYVECFSNLDFISLIIFSPWTEQTRASRMRVSPRDFSKFFLQIFFQNFFSNFFSNFFWKFFFKFFWKFFFNYK